VVRDGQSGGSGYGPRANNAVAARALALRGRPDLARRQPRRRCSQSGRHEAAELAFEKPGKGDGGAILEVWSDDLHPNG
jgi:hypothetical protein